MGNRNTVKSLAKAIDILDLLSASREGMTLSALSARSGFPKSTLHALLSTMRDRSLVRQSEDGKYALGLRLFEYGSAVTFGYDITAVARPYMERLSSLTACNTVISLIYDDAAVSFDYARSSAGVQIMPEIGSRLPLHATSQGKLLLSFMPEKKVKKLLEKTGMPSFTPHTLVDSEELICSLKEIKEQGYAAEDGEYKIGLRSVSAPVYDSAGTHRYALTTIGFFRRRDAREFLDAIRYTTEEAARLSKALGYQKKLS